LQEYVKHELCILDELLREFTFGNYMNQTSTTRPAGHTEWYMGKFSLYALNKSKVEVKSYSSQRSSVTCSGFTFPLSVY